MAETSATPRIGLAAKARRDLLAFAVLAGIVLVVFPSQGGGLFGPRRR